tara:strand:- start:248 stop:460 length:213 start_codon:yes stop_codon:yes gene_type:complete
MSRIKETIKTIKEGTEISLFHDGVKSIKFWNESSIESLYSKILEDIRNGIKEDSIFFNNFESRIDWKITK